MEYWISKKHYLPFIVASTLFTASSDALIVKLTDLHSMAKKSDIVIHGYVGDKTVVTDKLGRLTTLTEVEVIDGLYGAKSGEVITIYQVGGAKNGVVAPLIGGQHYEVGQELIFFGLKAGSAFVNYGGGQGKLDIVEDHGKQIVKEDLGNVIAVSGKDKRPFHPMPLTFPETSVVKDEIREMLKSR